MWYEMEKVKWYHKPIMTKGECIAYATITALFTAILILVFLDKYIGVI